MELFRIYKAPLYNAEDDFGGSENLNADEADEDQEEDVDLKDGEGTSEDDSQANEKPDEKKKQDRDTNEQFKAARVAAEKDKQRIIDEREQDAKDAGFESYAEMQTYIKQQKAEKERKYYEEQGINPDAVNQLIDNHPKIKQADEITAKYKVSNEMTLLVSKPFFKELEKDIENTLIHYLKTEAGGKDINPGTTVYNHIRGVKMDELLANKDKASSEEKRLIEKRTIANIADRKSRGLTGSSDSEPDGDIELTPEGKQMAAAFGNDPKEIAKYVKKQIRS